MRTSRASTTADSETIQSAFFDRRFRKDSQ